MIYICAQPATQYFGWQVDVMLHSFVTTGVNLLDVHIVGAIQGGVDKYFIKLKNKYPEVLFSFYEDTREDKKYVSSIRPHILKKHFEKHSYLENETIFYHDCDIALTKPIDFSGMLEDNFSYLSDTTSYIGYNYIKSKGEDVLDKMCSIMNVHKEVVKINQNNSGGAQYLIKKVNSKFWENVEKDSCNLFNGITELNNEKLKKDPNYHTLQIWCADMWAVLWNLWKINKDTKVHEKLNFSWSVNNVKEWHVNALYHNAGVTAKSKDLFFKGKYIKEMPDLKLNEGLDKTKCSYNYYLLLQQALWKEIY